METKIQIFNNPSFGEVRVAEVNGYKYPRAKVRVCQKYSKAGLDKVIIGG